MKKHDWHWEKIPGRAKRQRTTGQAYNIFLTLLHTTYLLSAFDKTSSSSIDIAMLPC